MQCPKCGNVVTKQQDITRYSEDAVTELLVEIRDHLYVPQDISRVRSMAMDLLKT